MTEKELRQKVADTAKKYIGCNPSDGSHRKIIDRYNADKPLPRGYKVQYNDAYCATFISAIAIECGLTDIIPKECGCGKMIDEYVKLGRWQEDDSYRPDISDVVFYDWEDNGIGDNKGAADHVGYVTAISGNTMKVTEGNMSGGKIGTRKLQVNGRYIRGYGLPDFAKKASGSSAGQTSGSATSGSSAGQAYGSTSGSLNRSPQWMGEVDVDAGKHLNVRKWAGEEYDRLVSYPQLNPGTQVEVCDSVKASGGSTWYYIRIAGKVYGFVHSDYIKKTESESVTEVKTETSKQYDIGDSVTFSGNTHYTSSYSSASGKSAKPCKAKVTNTSLSGVHPYHVVGASVHGWVDKEDIS